MSANIEMYLAFTACVQLHCAIPETLEPAILTTLTIVTEYFELLDLVYTSKDGKHGKDHITQSFWYDSNISGRSSYQN